MKKELFVNIRLASWSVEMRKQVVMTAHSIPCFNFLLLSGYLAFQCNKNEKLTMMILSRTSVTKNWKDPYT